MSTPTEIASAAADRFRALKAQATRRLAKARTDVTDLRARNLRESREMMARAKQNADGEPEERLVSPWPETADTPRYEFEGRDDETDAAPAPPERKPAEPAPPRAAAGSVRHAADDGDDGDDMSQEETWLR